MFIKLMRGRLALLLGTDLAEVEFEFLALKNVSIAATGLTGA